MPDTIIGVFANSADATRTITELDLIGITSDNIGFVTGDPELYDHTQKGLQAGVVTGLEAGVVTGGAAGFILAITAFALPAAAPIVAAGTLAATLSGAGVGAVLGGLIGVFTDHDMTSDHAKDAADHVNAGGTIITVKAAPEDAVRVKKVIEEHGGRTSVDDIPDAGTIVSDPLRFTSDTNYVPADENPIEELGASRQSRP